ncbi:MAG: zf-HC2 domain-containing protein [candidate division WOR-3 bacterium]
MNCSEARDKIPEYLAGLLDDPAELLKHLEACQACRGEMEVYRRLDAMLSFPPMPPDLPGQIIERMRAYRLSYASLGLEALTWLGAGLGASLAIWLVMLMNLNSIKDIIRFILAVI